METMTILPALEGRRFGSVPIGYDRIETMRTEFSALQALASMICGCPPENLTVRMVGDLTARLTSAASTLTPERLADVVNEIGLPHDAKRAAEALIALGVAVASTEISEVDK